MKSINPSQPETAEKPCRPARLKPMAAIPVLTIDGPGGAGKSTASTAVATRLGWHYLNSGALYRVLGLVAARLGIALEDAERLAEIASTLALRFANNQVLLENVPVDHLIRTEQAGDRASRLAAHAQVRKALLKWQRGCARAPGLVADGRDMGTVVFANADCKIFLTASAQTRAKRRFEQLRLKGFDVSIDQLSAEISERDRRDAERLVSPLVPADDAIVLDTTALSILQVVETIIGFLSR